MGQFLGEAFLITVMAFIAALNLIALLLPLFNRMAGTELALTQAGRPPVLLFLTGLLLLVAAGSGSYPAFVLTSSKPAAVISGKLSENIKGSRMQKLLVVG